MNLLSDDQIADKAMQSHPLSKQKSIQGQKKLRFITNQGAPHPKRRRINAACITCRKRKVACSGERPGCETCTQNKVECAGYSNEDSPASASSRRCKTETSEGSSQNVARASGTSTQQQHELPASSTGSDQQQPLVNGLQQSSASADPLSDRLTTIQEEHNSDRSGSGSSSSLFSGPRNRMPYFRYLGPTAIMPGFKQMIVKIIKRQDTNISQHSNDDGIISPSIDNPLMNGAQRNASVFSATPIPTESNAHLQLALPFYDTSSMPPSELITHLCTTFFVHLGCNFPFLRREHFLKDLEEKQVDAILVDAVCALAARFSTHQLLTDQFNEGSKMPPSEYGSAFAQRAKAALTDTFATPSVAAVQAALLLAYNEFGESRDSGLWMYLGISIRLAEDLGLQKLDGLRYEGRDGPTPRMVKEEERGKSTYSAMRDRTENTSNDDAQTAEDQRAVERERIDTFWAIFFLDRVVSSGTGRRSTLRDKDIELSFPSLDTIDSETGWPSPFPALIRIVHLYGRVADLLNGIKKPLDITEDTSRKLADMEAHVTNFYQGLSSKLHFQAMNFHHYVKAGEGTNFVLLHFWFHTLIVLLHQPTLLKTFEGKMLQLFPNSPQLSMSSAKTIADILSYSQLIDTKAGLGNPFTTQPIYIAACAFLKETAEQTATSKEQSRTHSRAASRANSPIKNNIPASNMSFASSAATDRLLARHTLLATAASQHYQLCYHALESLQTYWAGTTYILTVLDQKFKGVGDPLLYTVEEGESALEQPKPEPAFTSPGWRRKTSWLPTATAPFLFDPSRGKEKTSKGQGEAIGWTLTGTLNSPSTNLAWHFPSSSNKPLSSNTTDIQSQQHQHHRHYHQQHFGFHQSNASNPQSMSTPRARNHASGAHVRTVSSGSLPKSTRSHRPSLPAFASEQLLDTSALSYTTSPLGDNPLHFTSSHDVSPGYNFNTFTGFAGHDIATAGSGGIGKAENRAVNGESSNSGAGVVVNAGFEGASAGNMAQFGDLLIGSQDVDMSLLGLDMLPWFDAPDILPFLDGHPEGVDLNGGGLQDARTGDENGEA